MRTPNRLLLFAILTGTLLFAACGIDFNPNEDVGFLWKWGLIPGVKNLHILISAPILGLVGWFVILFFLHFPIPKFKIELEDGSKVNISIIRLIYRFFDVPARNRRLFNRWSALVIYVLAVILSGFIIHLLPATCPENGTKNDIPVPAPKGREVPPVVGLTKDEAYKILKGSGFDENEIIEKELPSRESEDIVFEQIPEGKGTLVEGRSIKLYISTGIPPEQVKIPKPGKDEDARAFADRLTEEGFNVIGYREIENSKVKKGYVIETKPPWGTKIDEGSDVSLLVSKGPKIPVVKEPPFVENLEYKKAAEILRDKGFGITVKRVPGNVKPGVVTAQYRPSNNTVAVDVCAGPTRCPVCNERVGLDAPQCPRCKKPLEWWRP